MSMRDLSKCPVFYEKEEDYEDWKVLVDDWSDMEGENRQYKCLELRRAVQGKALCMVSLVDREELKKKGGVKKILQELGKYYKREGRAHMMRKGKAYYRIQRGKEE